MAIEVTTLAPRAEHLLDERIKDETLTSLMEPTWLITPEGQGMISGPEWKMEENLADYIADREDEAHQLTDLYMFMLEGANKMGESLPGYLNRHHKNELAQENYDLFMKKYNQDMENFENFGEKDAAEFMDDGLLDAMKQQKNIRTQYPLNPEYQRLSKGGALRKITSSDKDPTMADFLATAAAGIVPGGLLVYGADRYGKRMDATEETPRPVSPQDQEFVNQRILELMMEEPVNEMRAVTPDMFERQKLGIERLLSNLYEPRRARDIAETISTAVDFSPAGIPTSIAEGIRMMGDDQPLMGAGMVALGISPFKGMPRGKLQGLLKKADEKLDNLRTRLYQAESKMKGGLSKADYDEGFKESIKIQADINKTTAEMDEMMEALYPKLANRKGYHQLGNRVPEKLAKKFDIDPMSPTAVDDYIKSAKLESVPVPEKQLASYPGDQTTFYFDPSTGEAFKRIITAGADDKLVSYTNNKLLPKYVKEAMARKNIKAVPESGTKEPDFFQGLAEKNPSFKKMLVEGRKDAGYIKPVKDESGIINATPEINRLFREISESPSRINTPQHQAAAKLTSEQLRKINQGIEKLEPTERDRVAELIQKLLEDR